MRQLSKTFLQDLLNGVLAQVLVCLREDDSLDLQIRENYLNVYFRGGSLLRISEVRQHVYAFEFDAKYGDLPGRSRTVIVAPLTEIASAEACTQWLAAVPLIKDLMARWFTVHPHRERDAQQVFTRENTCDAAIAGGTDYIVCDMEYAQGRARFDAVAVRWRSVASEKKRKTDHRLAFVELKYGDAALAGTSGLVAHVAQVEAFCGDAVALNGFKREMVGVFGQKHQLGLIHNTHSLESFSEERPELILVVANHDPASSILERELDRISLNPPTQVDVLVARASDFGYGLYEDRCLPIAAYLTSLRGGKSS